MVFTGDFLIYNNRMLLYITLILACLKISQARINPFSDKFINFINNKNTTWQAQKNFGYGTNITVIKGLMGELSEFQIQLPPKVVKLKPRGFSSSFMPSSFDARLKWPKCPSIGEIKDQGACGSCWAVATASIITDRVCIVSNGTINTRYSTEDLLTCCTNCGFGCQGGSSAAALNHWVTDGLVTGGEYGTNESCKPYSFEECQHHVDGPRKSCNTLSAITPVCIKECNSSYRYNYDDDIFFGEKVYVIGQNQRAIMEEICQFGPIVAIFEVFEDFIQYKSGVYQFLKGKLLGRHAIKMIGWGEEDGIPYWLVVNSWNTDWGLDGIFKILRGSNHCKIEEFVMAGMPPVPKLST